MPSPELVRGLRCLSAASGHQRIKIDLAHDRGHRAAPGLKDLRMRLAEYAYGLAVIDDLSRAAGDESLISGDLAKGILLPEEVHERIHVRCRLVVSDMGIRGEEAKAVLRHRSAVVALILYRDLADLEYYVDLDVADALGITIPEEILENAAYIMRNGENTIG